MKHFRPTRHLATILTAALAVAKGLPADVPTVAFNAITVERFTVLSAEPSASSVGA